MPDAPWSEWRGRQGNRPQRSLSQPELAALLNPFHIKPRTIWPLHRQPGDKSGRGYLRADFESAWASYCDPPDTPTQPGKIIRLAQQ
jgi:hypothetical protein